MNKEEYPNNKQMALAKASDWFTKIKDSPLKPKTKEEFHSWLNESPAHKKKLDQVKDIWNCTDVLIEELKEEDTFQKRNWIKQLFGGLPTFKYATVAATFALIVTCVWLIQRDFAIKETYYTVRGEQKEVILSDGSKVHLDTKTIITTSFTKELRQIELVEGRASFSVVKDPHRPYVVNAGRVSVIALGTVFSVYKRDNEQISVAVTEGRVSIVRQEGLLPIDNAKEPDISKTGKIIVEDIKEEKAEKPQLAQVQEVIVSGQKVTIDDKKGICKKVTVDTEEAETWRDGKLYFRKLPLNEVITEINRYLDKRIIIEDERLKDYRVTLSFFLKHRNNFLSTLKEAMPIKSRISLNGHIIITKKEYERL